MKGLQGFYVLEDISLNQDNFSFCIQRQNCFFFFFFFFLLCIHVELTAALGRTHTSVFPKFVVLEFEVMKDLTVLSALKLSH